MSRGERTRQHIIAQAAALFNQQGVAGSSVADIMEVTGLQKGGIYRHFGSKEELALAAYDYAVDVLEQRFLAGMAGTRDPLARLRGLLSVFRQHITRPPLPGGCPVMNTAIEADDTNAVLRDRAQRTMEQWRGTVADLLRQAVAAGRLRARVDPEEAATAMVGSLEGAVMLTRLTADPQHMRRAADFWTRYLEEDDSLGPPDDSTRSTGLPGRAGRRRRAPPG